MSKDYVTISEFRKNTKVILDGAKGDAITLRRGDDLFEMKYVGNIVTDLFDKIKQANKKTKPVEEEAYKHRYNVTPAENTVTVNLIPKRTKHTILDEINALEARQKEELEFCQDAGAAKDVSHRYKQEIGGLWTEYREAA